MITLAFYRIELSALIEESFGKRIRKDQIFKADVDGTQAEIDYLQKIIEKLHNKHRLMLIPQHSSTFKYIEIEECCLSQHKNPGFWVFYTETQKQIRRHPHADNLWLTKLRNKIKESEPLEFQKMRTHEPTTPQEFMEKLVSDFGRPNYYQRIIVAAFKKIGMIPKIRESNLVDLIEKLGTIQGIFRNIRLMEEHYVEQFQDRPTLLRATMIEGIFTNDFCLFLVRRHEPDEAMKLIEKLQGKLWKKN